MNPEQVLTLDKGKIRSFATESRVKLREHVEDRLRQYGVTAEEIKKPLPSSTPDTVFIDIGSTQAKAITGAEIAQRRRLVEELDRRTKELPLKDAVEELIDEVAYTWFNRLIAIRFMEVNEYLHNKEGNNHRLRILSSSDPNRSHMSTDIMDHPFDAGFSFTEEEEERIHRYQASHELEALFRLLFLKQCNELSGTLGFLFDSADGGDSYQELLFNIPYTMKGGIIRELIDNIPQVYFDVSQGGQIEIIGWLYQYYIDDKRDAVINIYKGNVKKEDIPAATQLFTTGWVVQYMVQNSLGRYWEERNPESKLQEKMPYFLSTNMLQVSEEIDLSELTLFDPCVGSGHILVYAFDLFMEMYLSRGYRAREAAQLIVENNLYGLDIDKRAAQLAQLSVMLKAREHDRRFFSRGIKPNVYSFEDASELEQEHLKYFGNSLSGAQRKQAETETKYLLKTFEHGRELGSIIKVEEALDFDLLTAFAKDLDIEQMSLETVGIGVTQEQLLHFITLAKLLTSKYSAVVTNPPYLNKMESHLKKYVREEYKDYWRDLFSVFIYRNFDFCVPNGYSGMMTPLVWMFIKSYEALREYIVTEKNITSLIQFEYSAFEDATVPICTFVLKNAKDSTEGAYIRLSDVKGNMQVQREYTLKAINDPNSNLLYHTTTENFTKIPGMPIAYWAKKEVFDSYNYPLLGESVIAVKGLDTCDNKRFVRMWYEVSERKIGYNVTSSEDTTSHKWFPYAKGGGFKKWYGFNDYIVNWENDGEILRDLRHPDGRMKSRPQNIRYYFSEGLTWSTVTSAKLSMRYMKNSIFGGGGSGYFSNFLLSDLAFLNSKVTQYYLNILNPTLNFLVGDILSLPTMHRCPSTKNQEVESLTKSSYHISIESYDNDETSRNFTKHPMLADTTSAETAYNQWRDFTAEQFAQLHANEEELNRIFIEIYGLEDELTPEVDPKDVTITKIVDDKKDKIAGNAYSMDKKEAIETFISYAVGCMFGRYSLDEEGLAFAGGQWDSSKYKTYQPVEDNIILITETDTGQKDIVRLFVEFVETVYGKENLEQNLKFIADSLGKRGSSSREEIRAYFYDDFYKDHTQRYQRTPIYWQFDSGRQGGFRALMYLHRYEKDTLGKARLNFLHPLQTAYESVISTNESIVSHSNDTREINQRKKENEGLSKKLTECREYDANLGHLAPLGIELDLDDGVEVNHEKVQTDREGKVYKILTNCR